MFDILKKAGVSIRKLKLPDKAVCGVFQHSVSTCSYAGRDCHRVQSDLTLEKIGEALYPRERREQLADGGPDFLSEGFDMAVWEGYHKFVRCWADYNACWSLLNDHSLHKNEKATKLRPLAMKFLQTFNASYRQTTHVYPHMLAAHVPDQLEHMDTDLWKSQTQPIENKHGFLKDAAANRVLKVSPGPAETVLKKAYTRVVRGKIQVVKEHHTKVKTCSSTEQLLTISAMTHHLRTVCTSVEQELAREAKTLHHERVRKEASRLKLERDLDAFKNLKI